jgi:methylase of polypeptide subunit release factors
VASKTSLKLVPDIETPKQGYKRFVGELWTAQQRQMHSLHYVVSYRASFKPELPDFCIKRYSKKGDIVLDPFCGRGTTALQSNLLGRISWGCDINPLAVKLARAKTTPVGLDEIVLRLNEVSFRRPVDLDGYKDVFAPFYHPDTYRELVNLRSFIKKKKDAVNNFIELLALSRLHGHSPGFFSVYSFPQISIPASNQRQINIRRGQTPEYRAVSPRIIRKAAQALRDGFTSDFFNVSEANLFEVADARNLSCIPSDSVDLIVTSPPFLDKVDYITDNWLEFWFAGISPNGFREQLVMSRTVADWSRFIKDVLQEMLRVLKPGSYAVVEVGEVLVGEEVLFLDEIVAQEARTIKKLQKHLVVEEVLVNQQKFTKLANCFKVDNNKKGTNTNRLVVLACRKKPGRVK